MQISYLVDLLGQQDSKLKEEKSRFVESENAKNSAKHTKESAVMFSQLQYMTELLKNKQQQKESAERAV